MNTQRTKLVYLLGRSEKELLAYDEYDSEGSGKWFTDNPMMAIEYNNERKIIEDAEKEKLDVYMWEATYDVKERKIIKEEIWLQYTNADFAVMKDNFDEKEK